MNTEKLPRNRIEEKNHLQRFVNLIPDLVACKIEFSDKPDLIIHRDCGDLGLEHTQLFRIDAGHGIVVPQAQEFLRRQVMKIAQSEFENKGGGMLQVHATFSGHDENALTKRNVNEVAQALATFMLNASYSFAEKSLVENCLLIENWHADDGDNAIPRQIDLINVRTTDRSGFVIWGVVDAGIVPQITAEQIQNEINKKNNKVEVYRERCSEIWLVMVADNGAISSYFNISDDAANVLYRSKFDRTFYFENIDSKIVELNTN